jgi:hypothetical protein
MRVRTTDRERYWKQQKFVGSHPDVSRNYQNRVVSVKHNNLLITIRLVTCFDPTGS